MSKRAPDPNRQTSIQSRVTPELASVVKKASDATGKPMSDLIAVASLEFADIILAIKKAQPSLQPHEIYNRATTALMSHKAFSQK